MMVIVKRSLPLIPLLNAEQLIGIAEVPKGTQRGRLEKRNWFKSTRQRHKDNRQAHGQKTGNCQGIYVQGLTGVSEARQRVKTLELIRTQVIHKINQALGRIAVKWNMTMSGTDTRKGNSLYICT